MLKTPEQPSPSIRSRIESSGGKTVRVLGVDPGIPGHRLGADR